MIDEDRLRTLISAYFDQSLDAAELRELEEMLLSSARARAMMHEHAETHGLLREWALRQDTDSLRKAVVGPFRRKRILPWIALAAAACLVAALFLRDRGAEKTRTAGQRVELEQNVALLSGVVDVEWEAGQAARSVGEPLPKGRIALAKGMIRVDFYSGASVLLEGPAALDLISADMARLDAGRLTANVPPPAQGFTVLSGGLRVVDRGTEFGMSVAPDDCQVHVFEGEVELHPDSGGAPVRSLFEGNAISFREGGSTDLVADSRSFASPRELLKAAENETSRQRQEWFTDSVRRREMEGLQIYYTFRGSSDDVGVRNEAADAPPGSDGIVIGCDRLPGRWSDKPAIGFARTSDRIRFRLDGASASATFLACLRVDSLPHDHNALLSTAPGEVGEIHWKLDRDGHLLVGLRAEAKQLFSAWERLVSPPVISENDLGRWLLLATVIDGEAMVMRHYVNGTEVASGPITRATPVRVGKANLGNFDSAATDLPISGLTRNFNGRIDEFAYFTRALGPEEIRSFR